MKPHGERLRSSARCRKCSASAQTARWNSGKTHGSRRPRLEERASCTLQQVGVRFTARHGHRKLFRDSGAEGLKAVSKMTGLWAVFAQKLRSGPSHLTDGSAIQASAHPLAHGPKLQAPELNAKAVRLCRGRPKCRSTFPANGVLGGLHVELRKRP